jgi:glucose/arabinose dehydrogenase
MKRILALAMLMQATTTVAQAPEPTPAFRGQTDAPPPAVESEYEVTVVTDELTAPWGLAFLPDGAFLVSERLGTLRIVSPDGQVSEPITGVPPVKVVAAQGFHDVVLDPDFAENRWLYFTYFAPPKGEAPRVWPNEHFYEEVWEKSLAERRVLDLGQETVARARLSKDKRWLEDFEILTQSRVERRIAFAPDGTMFVTGADAFRFYDSDLDGIEHDVPFEPDVRRNFTGRVIRINPDGTIPADNPWLGRATVSRETYAHGFKDSEGAAIHPETGELWVTDHGPQGGDEIDIVRPGRDYGWPEVSHGVQYDARRRDGRKNVPVGLGKTSMPGVEEPIYYWVPSIAPSGMAFYTGDLFPEWRGNLFVGAMAGRHLVRLVLDGERVVAEEKLLEELNLRIREVRQGPDGALYVFGGDSLLKITPPGTAHERIVGVYSLARYAAHGDNPTGRISYDSAGRMWAMLLPPGRKPVTRSSSPEAYRAAMRGLVSYYGTYEIDTATGRVIHHVEAASNPAWVGTDFVRWFRFDGPDLVISLNPRFENTLLWKRLPER